MTPVDFDSLVSLIRRYDKPGTPLHVLSDGGRIQRPFRRSGIPDAARRDAATTTPISLYVHLPFCEDRCSFCGCSVIITRKREVAAGYLTYLHREIAMLAEALGTRRQVVQYHWGGGTPTYLSLAQIAALQAVVNRHFDIQTGAELAIEVDPRVTSVEQLKLLRDLGFNRLSLGVQDFTPEVQQAINRIQSEPLTRTLFEAARDLGFESINIDLIYGLPLQTRASFGRTVDAVVAMRPDRVAVYSYAHVPWIRGHQKYLNPEDLPPAELKIELFVEAMERFRAAGYAQIGMDHFALPTDELAIASAAGRLHRNFMGYTTRPAPDMLAAGVSGIGDVGGAFAQNTKKLSAYYSAIDGGRFPIERGYRLERDDHIRRFVITNLMCNFRVERREVATRFSVEFDKYFEAELSELAESAVADGFVSVDAEAVTVTPLGRLFVRNVAMVFDRHLRARTASATPVFSRTV